MNAPVPSIKAVTPENLSADPTPGTGPRFLGDEEVAPVSVYARARKDGGLINLCERARNVRSPLTADGVGVLALFAGRVSRLAEDAFENGAGLWGGEGEQTEARIELGYAHDWLRLAQTIAASVLDATHSGPVQDAPPPAAKPSPLTPNTLGDLRALLQEMESQALELGEGDLALIALDLRHFLASPDASRVAYVSSAIAKLSEFNAQWARDAKGEEAAKSCAAETSTAVHILHAVISECFPMRGAV